MEGKTCYKCNQWKSLDKFPKDNRQKDGRRNYCKVCRNKRTKELFQENPDPRRNYQKKWKEKNFEYIREWKKQYALENREKISEKKKLYYLKTKDYKKEYCYKYYRENKDEIKKRAYDFYHKNKEQINEERRLERQINPEIREKERLYWGERREQKRAKDRRWRNNNLKLVRELKRLWYTSEKGRAASYKASLKRRSYKQKVTFVPHQRTAILDRDKWKCQACGIKVHDRSSGNWNTPDKAHIDHILPISKGGNSEPSNLQTLCRTCNLTKSDKVEYQLPLF